MKFQVTDWNIIYSEDPGSSDSVFLINYSTKKSKSLCNFHLNSFLCTFFNSCVIEVLRKWKLFLQKLFWICIIKQCHKIHFYQGYFNLIKIFWICNFPQDLVLLMKISQNTSSLPISFFCAMLILKRSCLFTLFQNWTFLWIEQKYAVWLNE